MEDDIDTWYDFENNIEILTHNLFTNAIMGEIDTKTQEAQTELIRKIFTDIHSLLLEYLREQVENTEFTELSSVRKVIANNTPMINFNYTNIAENYSDNAIYVHGSIAENDVLLGYDYRMESNIACYDEMRWSKIFRREELNFRRCLRNNGLLHNSDEYKNLIDNFERYQQLENSGRGIEDSDEDNIPHYKFIKEFSDQYTKNYLPKIDYKSINTLVVLGHGIEADKKFLREILEKCVSLKKVIVFTFKGENKNNFQRKVRFFKPYCKNVISKKYES